MPLGARPRSYRREQETEIYRELRSREAVDELKRPPRKSLIFRCRCQFAYAQPAGLGQSVSICKGIGADVHGFLRGFDGTDDEGGSL